MSLTYRSLQVLSWNNDSIIKNMNACKWCRHINRLPLYKNWSFPLRKFCGFGHIYWTLIKNFIFCAVFFQNIHAWNQGCIKIIIYDISLLQFLFCKNSELERMCDCNSSLIWQKGESQNGGNKNTKHTKFSEKGTFFTPLIPPFATLTTNCSFMI